MENQKLWIRWRRISALHTTSVGRTKRKGAIATIHHRYTPGGEHGVSVEQSEEGKAHRVQQPLYFLSKVLSPSKQRYPHYKKLAYNVFTTAWKLQQYFTVHPIIMVNEAPL
jgi:hypothetical protein